MQAKKSVLLTTMVDAHIHARTKQRENALFVVAKLQDLSEYASFHGA
jgi:hypothetical protein